MNAAKVVLFTLAISQHAVAQEEPEEIIVTGQRSTLQLRVELMESERLAYDLFNQFNDDRRFDISCSVENRMGSNLGQQTCQPEFEIRATRAHARDYLESMPGRQDGFPVASVAPTYSAIPMEAEIARHQPAFRSKMKEVAEQHPEFLDAIKHYAELRQQYEARTKGVEAE